MMLTGGLTNYSSTTAFSGVLVKRYVPSRIKAFVVLTVCLGLAACTLFETEPFADTHTAPNGQLVLGDTPGNWSDFTENVDFRIANELEGGRPEAGKKNWSEFWVWFISSQDEGRENKQRYVNYVVETRRAHGLPELDVRT